MIGHGGLLRAFSFARPVRGAAHVWGIYPQTCPDLGFAVQFNVETPWHFAQRLDYGQIRGGRSFPWIIAVD